jgi:hypothetical protein
MKAWWRWALVAALVLGAGAPAFAAPAGKVVFARGMVTAYTAGGTARIVGAESPLAVGEVISTGPRGVARLELGDGNRITLRPNSTFEITAFDASEDTGSALYTLFKGGLRAVTGFLSKRNPDAVRLKTSVATIGIRGTEFDARLCEDDCAAEAAKRPAPAGRAGFVKGRVMARASSGRARALASGDAVYTGDTVISDAGAYAVIAFRDDSRVTVLPETEFRVETLDFDSAAPEQGSAVFRLLRGGLRAVTGLIGKRNGRGYRMSTAVATIGIRGTGYDLLCQGVCQNPAPGAGPDGDGLFSEVWDGAILIDGVHEVQSGQAVFIADTGFAPVPVPGLPRSLGEPRPGDVPLPPPPPSSSNPQQGLYVSCYAGNCAVQTDDNVVELGPGEAGHVGAGGGPAQALSEVPPFQAEDPVLHALEVGGSLSTFNQQIDSGGPQCTVR